MLGKDAFEAGLHNDRFTVASKKPDMFQNNQVDLTGQPIAPAASAPSAKTKRELMWEQRMAARNGVAP